MKGEHHSSSWQTQILPWLFKFMAKNITYGNLLSNKTLVETPFIVMTIGEHTFGKFTRGSSSQRIAYGMVVGGDRIEFPNFMESLQVVKINGTVNTYTIGMVYPVTQGSDPNLLEKIFGSISESRMIEISYGDLSQSTLAYRKEKAIITQVTSNIDFEHGCLRYTIKATSTSLALLSGTHNFRAQTAKPSTVIKDLFNDMSYGLQKVFNPSKSKIATDDAPVKIEEKTNMNMLDYLNYLLGIMSPTDSTDKYMMSISDETTEDGDANASLSVTRVSQGNTDTVDTYEITIGYPDDTPVCGFSLDNQETYAILYNYSQEIGQTDYQYRISDDGMIDEIYSPAISTNSDKLITTEATKQWWSHMTQYPVNCTVTIRGLLRPAILMTYVRLNVYFFGHKHISSGLYIITQQIDTVDKIGFRTQLKLLRVGEDEEGASGYTKVSADTLMQYH